MVTHLTTNPPVRCLNRAERTGSLVFNVLWSYVKAWLQSIIYNLIVNEAFDVDHVGFDLLLDGCVHRKE